MQSNDESNIVPTGFSSNPPVIQETKYMEIRELVYEQISEPWRVRLEMRVNDDLGLSHELQASIIRELYQVFRHNEKHFAELVESQSESVLRPFLECVKDINKEMMKEHRMMKSAIVTIRASAMHYNRASKLWQGVVVNYIQTINL